MNYKFYSPYLIWFGIWVFICMAVSLITLENNKLYLQTSVAISRLLDYNRPYGEFARLFGYSQEPLDRYLFPPRYRPPLRPLSTKPPFSPFPEPDTGDREEGGLAFWLPTAPSVPETAGWQREWLQAWQRATRASYVVTLFSYLIFVVGFGAICLISAIYQNHFRRAQEEQFETEIEARNLRIQVLESSRDALDLKLQLLDQEHGRAMLAAQESQENIRNLEERLQSEAGRNEELQAELQKALQEENQAKNLLLTLDLDRQRLAGELTDITSRLTAAEKPPEEDRYRLKTRKAKARLRLKSFWLAALYKNLSFSPRALQNLMEVQEAPDVFPSLPDALVILNNVSLKALLSGESLPPKTVSRYSTQELEYFRGPFWEYRFSADGRIFFGLSQSRVWNIDTILLKRRFPDKKEKYDRYLAGTLGKDNQDIQAELMP
ncbi:MAG: hypothetical protein AB1424_04265 [Thermodesulfobacteriota bacterium]